MSGRPAQVAVGPQEIEGRARGGQAVRMGLALVPLILAMAVWAMTPSIGINADSPRYLAGSAMRTATYPIFLDLVNGAALLPMQLFLFAGSLSWFAIYVGRYLAFWLTALLTVAIAINPYVWQLQGTILSESLTTPLLTIIAGCLIAFSIAGRSGPMVAAALLSGLAVTISARALRHYSRAAHCGVDRAGDQAFPPDGADASGIFRSDRGRASLFASRPRLRPDLADGPARLHEGSHS